MSRVYWDTMLFIYWLEDDPQFADRVNEIFGRMLDRSDRLITSGFTLGELLVGPTKTGAAELGDRIRRFLNGPDVDLLQLDSAVFEQYAWIRARHKVRPADAIHLACAARFGTDLFLTNDRAVQRLIIPGIQFIAGLDVNVL